MKDDATKTASVLAYNYPKSKWYRYSYNLIDEKPEISLKNRLLGFVKKNEEN